VRAASASDGIRGNDCSEIRAGTLCEDSPDVLRNCMPVYSARRESSRLCSNSAVNWG